MDTDIEAVFNRLRPDELQALLISLGLQGGTAAPEAPGPAAAQTQRRPDRPS